MAGSKIFSILDANQAFWQIELTEEDAKKTTFNTLFVRFSFMRLPYGISSAPEVFHRCFSKIFEDVDGVETFTDDLLIHAESQTKHDETLRIVLERARKVGIMFNKKKCHFWVKEVKYLGQIFTDKWMKLDKEKIKAIVEMERPTNAKQLATFLGMITYIAKFIPNVSNYTAPLRSLVKKDIDWQWNTEQEKAFQKLKAILIKQPVMQYFDPKKEVMVSVDASKDGLGAVLLQDNLPIAYAAKALNPTQQAYAQIEKKALAIVFGCERFHQYIYGKNVTIESDHKPLEATFRKPLNDCPAKLQRMRNMT